MLIPDPNQDQSAPSQPEVSLEEPAFGVIVKGECALLLLVMSTTVVSRNGLFGAGLCSLSTPVLLNTPEFCAKGLKLLVRDVADGNEGNGTVSI